MRLILGSSSKWRRQLWQQHFPEEHSDFMSPDIDEKSIRHDDAEALTLLIANAKADALVTTLQHDEPKLLQEDVLLICMDQVVRCDGAIREKPESDEQVRAYLQTYSEGKPAECVNGLVVHNLRTGVRFGANEIARVLFDPIPEFVVERAIEERSIFDSAGAFAIEDPLFAPLVRAVLGSREAIIGLPLDMLQALIDAATFSASHTGTSRVPLPSEIAPGFTIRPLRPSDEDAAKDLFALGMASTIVPGCRRELLRPGSPLSVFVAAACALGGAAIRRGAVPQRGALAAACVAAAGLIATAILLPRRLAQTYIAKELQHDMKSPRQHYFRERGSCFWVAVEESTGAIAGTAALEPPGATGAQCDDVGWRWSSGDAELRRMSVAPWAQRKGVATALFAELRRFAEQAPHYERIVLSTSTLQRAAHDYLYPKLGFGVEKRMQIYGGITCTHFALPLRA